MITDEKIRKFIALAGQFTGQDFHTGSPEQRMLGAQLLLSEVLEYVIKGLGVLPEVKGTKITEPDALNYHINTEPNKTEMLDGLSDVAYTMFWNSVTFAVPLAEGFDLVCDNNLQKFVRLHDWQGDPRELARDEWNCGQNVTWPNDVVSVYAIEVKGEFYAVGKDKRGKVRKPSSYSPVNLTHLVSKPAE